LFFFYFLFFIFHFLFWLLTFIMISSILWNSQYLISIDQSKSQSDIENLSILINSHQFSVFSLQSSIFNLHIPSLQFPVSNGSNFKDLNFLIYWIFYFWINLSLISESWNRGIMESLNGGILEYENIVFCVGPFLRSIVMIQFVNERVKKWIREWVNTGTSE
jgi:hypothetical protein